MGRLIKKKRSKNIFRRFALVIAVLMAVTMSGCTSGSDETQGDDDSDSPLSQAEQVEKPVFTPETLPVIDGSLATVPLFEAIAAAVTNTDVDTARQYVEYTNTHPSYISLIDGERDVIFVTAPSEEEKAYAASKGVELETVPVVSEGFVFFVNSENPVEGLTLQQIRDIYTGKITNWSEAGGEDVELTPYQRRVNSGSQSGMLELVMKDTPIMDAPKEDVIAEMGEIIDAVAQYKNSKDAIGYSYFYFVTDMYGDSGIKLLKIDDVYPDKTTINDGTYPIQTAYYAVFNADEPEDSPVRKLVNWVRSEEGQRLAEEAGYVRVKQ